jgi:hypothetical protein
LNVQLRGALNDGSVKLVDTLHDLRNDVFADPQRLNPGNIDIVRTIVTPPPSDAEVDTAVFTGNQAEYAITVQPDGTVIVDHGAGVDGRDTLRNVELLAFADGTIPVPTDPQVTVPTLVGLQLQDAQLVISLLGLDVVVEIVESNAPADQVLVQAPPAGTLVTAGSTVSLQISHGVELVPAPNVVGQLRASATAEIIEQGFLVGAITNATSTTVEPGMVISQNPAAGQPAALEGPIDLVVSVGRPGLVLSLNFDEANGAALDASPSARNGALRGATRVPGKVGTALSFDGVDDWVTVLDGAAGTPLDLTNGMTLEAWVRPGTMTGWETVIMKERGAGNLSYALYAMDGGASGSVAPSGTIRVGNADRTVVGTTQLPAATWTHLATTYDGITQRLYVNGTQVASRPQTGNMTVGNQALRVGGNGSFAGEFYNGLIDNVRVYNRALSEAEIDAEIAAAGGTVAPPPPPPPVDPALPVLSLNFDEATGDAADTATGLVGTVSGAVRVPGIRGRALSFDGVNDSVTVPDAASLDLTAGMTLAAWVNPGAVDGWETIILKENGAAYSYALYSQDGGAVQGGAPEPSGNVLIGGDFETVQGANALTSGTWAHLATTFDGTTLRVFVNGVEVSNEAIAGAIDVGGGALRIGGNDVWAGEYFQGLIDEVRVYSRALTAAEIQAVMNPAP